MPLVRIIYITIVVATVAIRTVILVRNWQLYRREGEEGLRAESRQGAVEKMTKQIRGGY